MGVTPTSLPIVFALGGAVLALWLDARAPRLRPRRARFYLAHLVAAAVGIELAAILIEKTASSGEAVLAASLFAGLLPAFVYVFLTSLWLIRVAVDPPRS
jgi:hypothetical protein